MPFAALCPLGKRPKQISADGVAEYPDDAERWKLYSAVERGLEERTAAPMARGGGESSGTAAAPQPSPQKVLESLSTARGELDVILDLVSMVEQQQFLAVAHVPKVADPAAAAQERTLRLARRRAQLQSTAERLKRGAAALEQQARLDNAFISDVAELRKRWKLGRHVVSGGAFYVDLALTLTEEAAEGVTQEGAQHAVVPDASGKACIVLVEVDGSRIVVRGPAAISAALQLRQELLAWRVISQLIARELREPQHSADPDGALAALQCMAAEAVQRRQRLPMEGTSVSDAMDVDSPAGELVEAPRAVTFSPPRSLDQSSAAAGDVLAFCATADVQERFEAKAMKVLVGIMLAARTPALVAAVRSQVLPTGLLADVAAWLRHAALRLGVATALEEQAVALGGRATVAEVDTAEELAAAWRLHAGGRALGVVVVSGTSLRWEASSGIAGAGGALGRKQLRGLLARTSGQELLHP